MYKKSLVTAIVSTTGILSCLTQMLKEFEEKQNFKQMKIEDDLDGYEFQFFDWDDLEDLTKIDVPTEGPKLTVDSSFKEIEKKLNKVTWDGHEIDAMRYIIDLFSGIDLRKYDVDIKETTDKLKINLIPKQKVVPTIEEIDKAFKAYEKDFPSGVRGRAFDKYPIPPEDKG